MKKLDLALELNMLQHDPGNVALPVRFGVMAIAAAVVAYAGYNFFVSEKFAELDGVTQIEQTLRSDYEKKFVKAANLEKYQAQLAEMDDMFSEMLKQLPNSTEIPGLILDISEKGISNGLEITSFKPSKEKIEEYYAEKPLQLVAHGSYIQLANFVSDLSGLSRIVTINDINIKPKEEEKKSTKKDAAKPIKKAPGGMKILTLNAVVSTYRYLDEEDQKEKPTKRKKRK